MIAGANVGDADAMTMNGLPTILLVCAVVFAVAAITALVVTILQSRSQARRDVLEAAGLLDAERAADAAARASGVVPVTPSENAQPPPAATPPAGRAARPQVAAQSTVDGHTRVSRPSAPAPAPITRWQLVANDDGTAITVHGAVVVGRSPSPDAAPGAQLVPIDDPHRSISKTHALLRSDASGLSIEDLDSTNGVRVVREGEGVTISPRTPTPLQVGETVLIGDREFVVERPR